MFLIISKKRVSMILLAAIPLFIFCLSALHLDAKLAYSADKHGNHVLEPRVPADRLAEAKALKRPVPRSEKTIAEGKEIFHGKGVCANCHGDEGKGDGPIASSFDPRPRDFYDADDLGWQKVRTDGEIFWAISKGTTEGMLPYEDMLSLEERWALVDYIRSLEKSVVANHK